MRLSLSAGVCLVLLTSANIASAQSTYTWTFDGNPGSGAVGSGNPANPANITLTNFTRTGVIATNGNNVFNSDNWSTSTSLDTSTSVGFTIAPASGRLLYLTSLDYLPFSSTNGPNSLA